MNLTRLPLALLLLAACSAPVTLPEGEIYGEPMQTRESVRLSVVENDPASYYDQTLLVEAKVIAVCQKAGCWMQIEDEGKKAMVRWESGCGGQYQFPTALVGERVLIQGSFYSKTLSAEDAEHIAEEAGGKLDLELEGHEMNASSVLKIG